MLKVSLWCNCDESCEEVGDSKLTESLIVWWAIMMSRYTLNLSAMWSTLEAPSMVKEFSAKKTRENNSLISLSDWLWIPTALLVVVAFWLHQINAGELNIQTQQSHERSTCDEISLSRVRFVERKATQKSDWIVQQGTTIEIILWTFLVERLFGRQRNAHKRMNC